MTALQTAVLDLVAARDLAFAGGKAVNLAELIGAGFPVPDGFCVGTPAYAQAAAMGGLDAVLAEPGQDLPGRARAALLATSVPAEIAAAITEAYVALGDRVPVAVRSSATAEDLPGASFAGQQDTYLNVVGVDAVLDAVRRCWASLWTDRAVSYRADAGIPHAGTQLAVVVQRMVDARVAGVLFTAAILLLVLYSTLGNAKYRCDLGSRTGSGRGCDNYRSQSHSAGCRVRGFHQLR
jgi:pyruvate,water dikinase